MDRINGMVVELLEVTSGLSQWELEFIDNVDRILRANLAQSAFAILSPLQIAKIEAMWDHHLG